MLPVDSVNEILKPYQLTLTDGGTRVKSTEFQFGTVSIEAIYEMMFIHDVSRSQALQDISMLLNIASPEKKYDPPRKKRKAKAVAV